MYVNAVLGNVVPPTPQLKIHPGGGCRTCHYWGGWTTTRPLPSGYLVTLIGATALCLRTTRTDVQSATGCADWQRETGTDDYL